MITHLKRVFYGSNLILSSRILISLICMTFIPWYFGRTDLVIPTTLGVLAASVSDIDDTSLGRLRNFFITSICFLVTSFSVELLFPYFWLFLLGLMISTFVFTFLGILGERFSVIAFGSLLIASYTMIGYHMYSTLFLQPLYLMIGVIVYNVVALIESMFQPIRSVQNNLANCFYELGNYLNCKSALFDPDEQHQFKRQIFALAQANRSLIRVLNKAKPILFNHLNTRRNHVQSHRMMNYYFVAQDIHERASASHLQYQNLATHFKHSDLIFRFARILGRQAFACTDLANSIRLQQRYQHNMQFKSDFLFLYEAIEQINATTKENRLLVYSLWTLFHNLQAIDALLANINKEKIYPESQDRYDISPQKKTTLKQKLIIIKQNFTTKSLLFRHAIRISLVLGVDYIVIQLSQLEHGYWIILTSLLVCQPNSTTTKHRLKLRIIGTMLGSLLGLPLTYLFPNIEAQLFLIALSGWLFFIFKNTQYAFGTIFITLMVFFSFGLIGESTLMVAAYRIIATLIGSSIAYLGVTFLWPDWKYRNLTKQINDMCLSNSHYLSLIGHQYQTRNINEVNYVFARHEAYEADITLFNVLNIMTTEPHANVKQIDKGFRLLMLNHSLLSFMSTLGTHRRNPLSDETMSLFDDCTVYIIMVLNSKMPSIGQENIEIKKQLSMRMDKLSLKEECKSDLLIVQQLQFILDLLPEFMQLVTDVTSNQGKKSYQNPLA